MNVFEKGKKIRKGQTKSERLLDGVDAWTSFYRANPHRFVRDYFGIELKLFQQILLYAMMHNYFFVYIASRGQGKTWLTAIFCLTRSILYPETKIIVAAGLKSQSREVIEKIDELRKNSPNLQREIEDLKTSVNDAKVDFHNGSWIKTVASNDGARGKRSNLLIVDEFRMVDLNVINSVLRKFQTAPRQPKFLNKPEYKDREDLKERNKEIYLSSAWYKSHHSWEKVTTYTESMTDGKSYFVCSLPYQIAIKEGLLMEDQVKDEMSEKSFDPVSWMIEMESLFYGISDKAFFSFDDLQKNRKVGKVFYPQEVAELVNDKNIGYPKKVAGELRIVSADIATMAGAQNDASAFTLARLIPSDSGYETQIVYIESIEGGHTAHQAMRIRQLYTDFNADYIVLDTFNAGIGIFDALTQTQIDTSRGIEYEPLSCMNNEELAKRCVYPNAPKVIYSVRASAQLNSEIASVFRDSLRQGKIKLPIPENEAEDFLKTIKGYDKLPEELKVKFRLPYIQTSLMINEVLNLESEITDTGLIKLREIGKARKDRYSSISYLSLLANELGIKNRKRRQEIDPSKLFMVKKARNNYHY